MVLSLQEVGKKTERITALEREKAVLIRELFQARTVLRGGGSSSSNFSYQQGAPVMAPRPVSAAGQAPTSSNHHGSPGLGGSNRNTPNIMMGGRLNQTGAKSGLNRRPTEESAFL